MLTYLTGQTRCSATATDLRGAQSYSTSFSITATCTLPQQDNFRWNALPWPETHTYKPPVPEQHFHMRDPSARGCGSTWWCLGWSVSLPVIS